jgi:1,2-diacylglycerol 3-alpha-glucosyltransferase
MKIGIVTTWFERGAAYVSKQFKEVWEQNHDVYIYVRGGEVVADPNSDWNKGNITYGKRYDYSNLDFIDLVHFQEWITTNNLDIVFFNEQHLWKPVLLCHDLKVKTGAYIDYYTKQTVPFFELYDFLVCNTQRHFKVFEWHPNPYYIPWGTDTDIYNISQQKKTIKSEVVFFHSAGMNPYRKGSDFVLKAFNELQSEKAKLIIHTQLKIIDFFPELKQVIKKLEKNKQLLIIERTVSAPGLYILGDIYVYPSRLEGIGLTIAEASACGMPVITTNMAPMNEFVKSDINGKLVKVKRQKKRNDAYYWEESEVDIVDLKNQMQFYIDNIELLDQFKKDALLYAHKNLNWQKNSKFLLDLVNDVCPLEVKHKDRIYKVVKKFEASRGVWFYFANTKVYRNLKGKYTNLKKKISL